jgi:hypothetical protein
VTDISKRRYRSSSNTSSNGKRGCIAGLEPLAKTIPPVCCVKPGAGHSWTISYVEEIRGLVVMNQGIAGLEQQLMRGHDALLVFSVKVSQFVIFHHYLIRVDFFVDHVDNHFDFGAFNIQLDHAYRLALAHEQQLVDGQGLDFDIFRIYMMATLILKQRM